MGDRIKDKVALVLGAGSVGPGWGNGKATAVLYAREGARVVLVDLTEPVDGEDKICGGVLEVFVERFTG